MNIPNHVGIILDGNRRWAKERGLKSSDGHKAGYENLKTLCKHVFEKGVKYLSVFAFSTENFKRSEEEVSYLMNLIAKQFKKDAHYFTDNDIKVVFSGRREGLNENVLESMDYLSNITKDNKRGIMNICINYGGRAEIVDAVKKIAGSVNEGSIQISEIDEDMLMKNMYIDLPDMDFLIRTSGESRISNFMLYQLSYAELYFPSVYFPDFNEKEFDNALEEYNNRNRRFGGNS